MNKLLRRLLGVIGIGLSWGLTWGVLFAAVGLIIGVVRPQDIDPGENALVISGIGFVVGFVSGTIFGLILSVAENRKAVSALALIRVALWGVLGATAWPLLTPLPNDMLFVLCPLGAVCASVFVAIARRAAAAKPEKAHLLKYADRLLASPLRAACESNG
jgi:hypothetical protein